MKDVLELLKSLSKEDVEFYRGKVKEETMELHKQLSDELDKAKDELLAKKKQFRKFWDKVYEELDIDPDKYYRVEPLTGQVFEMMPVDELKASKEG